MVYYIIFFYKYNLINNFGILNLFIDNCIKRKLKGEIVCFSFSIYCLNCI